MFEIKTEILIATTPEHVWSYIIDINHWKRWNPIIAEAQGNIELNQKIELTMKGKGEKHGPKYSPSIIICEKPHHLRWSTKILFGLMMKNDKILKLELHDGLTKLTHIEAFGGLMALFFRKQFEKGVPVMLQSMNEALKKNLEDEKSQNIQLVK